MPSFFVSALASAPAAFAAGGLRCERLTFPRAPPRRNSRRTRVGTASRMTSNVEQSTREISWLLRHRAQKRESPAEAGTMPTQSASRRARFRDAARPNHSLWGERSVRWRRQTGTRQRSRTRSTDPTRSSSPPYPEAGRASSRISSPCSRPARSPSPRVSTTRFAPPRSEACGSRSLRPTPVGVRS